ncbi:Sds3-like-domain-containing protein [Lentinula detonsa]|uniref:Sds3-like-domain-containing protein n=1 Tax=Lentinula detonsa TaxID=2804962 RepID=A0A9W8P456_9AGAR|nr:Sds3-like-domain-containing protein [Lentinula detonsa]
MGGSTNSLDSLSSPSPSPPPSLNKAEGSVSKSASTKQKSPEPTAGLDSDSELSELTEEEQDEKQKHKQKQKKPGLNSLSPGASRSSSSNRRGTGSAVRGGSRRGGRKKRSTFVPAPMWGWAMYSAEQDTEKSNGAGEENEEKDETANVHISPNSISAPNPLDVLTSAALDAENFRSAFSRLKSNSQETEEEEERPINISEAQDVTVVVDGDIDITNSATIRKQTTLVVNDISSIASSRAPTPDSIASSRPSPPKDVPSVAYVSTSRLPVGASTTEDEDDNTELEEDEIDEQPKPVTTTKSRPKPDLRIDASAQLPSNVTSNSADPHSPSPHLPPLSASFVKSPIKSSTTTVTATNSKPRSSRGGRGRGRGRGRARTRGTRVNVPSEVDRPTTVDNVDDQVGTAGVSINVPPSKDDAMNIDVDNLDGAILRNSKSELSKVADYEDEIMEPEEGTSVTDANKPVVDPDEEPSDKSDAEPELEIDVDVNPEPEVEIDAPSDVSDGEDEKEDELDEAEGEDEKDDPDELEVDEEKEDDDKEDEDKDDEDKEASDDVEKDIDDDDRSEVNLEDEEEESDLQPAHRVEALDMLAVIELKFALLRERLYIEKMEELAWEESLVSNGEHPELIYIQSELLSRKNKRSELAERKCTFEIANITKRRRIDEDATWSSWKLQRDELQTDMIAENNRKRRKLERERRTVDRPQTARRIPFPPNSDYLPSAPTLRQIVDSFPFTNSNQIIHSHRNDLTHKNQGRKESQVNGSRRSHIRGVNGISHGINAQDTPGLTVAYPKLSTLSSSEAQEDLEALLGMTGARRTGSGSAPMTTIGMTLNMNMNIGNMGMNMDTNIGMNPMYEQGNYGPSAGLGSSHVPHGHIYTSSGTPNGPNPNSNRERLGQGPSPSLPHGSGPTRRIVSGVLTSPGSSLGLSQSSLSMGHAHESQFAMGVLPPQIGGGGGSEPLFGPNRPMGAAAPRPGSSAGLRSTAGGGERERELRSVPTGSSGGGGRSTFHHVQSHHLLSGPPISANNAFSELDRQPDGGVIMASSATSSAHGAHGRQVSSSTHFGPVGPGVGGEDAPPASSSRRRSLSPIGPGVGIGPNGVKGTGQWMGTGMGMGGFGPGHSGNQWEEEEREYERERMGHRDVRDSRGHERERERDRDRDRDQHIVHQQRHLQQEQQHVRPQSIGPTATGASAPPPPSHVHSHPNQAPHHHHHVRPHHHHIVHHHHGPSAGSQNTSPTTMRGPSLSPRMSRVEMFSERERENGNGPPRAPAHLPTEVINLISSKPTQVGPTALSHSSSTRIAEEPSPEYRDRERDARRMSSGRLSSITGPRIIDERERDRDKDRDKDRDRAGSMPFVSGPNSQTQQMNGLATSSSSASSSRPTSWNAVGRDDLYRQDSIHSSSSPIHARGGSIIPGPPTTTAFGPPSTISPPRTRALPPRTATPAVASLVGHSSSGPAEQHMRSPSRNRERPPLVTPQNQSNTGHNSNPKILRSSSPSSTNALVSPVAIQTLKRMPLSSDSLPIPTASNSAPEDIVKNGAPVKSLGATVSPLTISQNSSIKQRTSDASLGQQRGGAAQVDDGHLP